LVAVAALTAIVPSPTAVAASPVPAREPAEAPSTATATTDQILVHVRQPVARSTVRALAVDASEAVDTTVTGLRQLASDRSTYIVELDRPADAAELAALTADLEASPGVVWAEPDVRMRPTVTPTDPLYGSYQWDLTAPVTGRIGANLPGAWDLTTGSAAVRVAVIDTGFLDHPDLAGRLIGGYDFVGDPETGNDGDGRDPDARDPGDWVTAEEDAGPVYTGCGVTDSSWHGTHVAGTIGASANNGIGITGINWTSPIVPVRALGKCGGYTSDIIDGLRWAAGLPVSGVPDNPHPARVLNLSLGGDGPCSFSFQSAIDAVVAAGAVVVVASGNEGIEVAYTGPGTGASPANCDNVIAVAATSRTGRKASYSNTGSKVDIAAPGGDSAFDGGNGTIISTLNDGLTTPGSAIYEFYEGTSMAAPHVAGIVSLMLSRNAALSPAEVSSILRSTARAFSPLSGCTTSICGAGIVDAAAAVAAVPAATPGPSPDPSPGSGFVGVTPRRLVDSRVGEPQGAVSVVKQQYGGAAVLQVPVLGVGGVPGSGVGAVALNVTVTGSSGAGFASVFPCGGAVPGVSSVNFGAGQTVANAVVAPVGSGTVCVYSNVMTDVIVDVSGWFAS
jgi:serine protease